MMTDRATFVRFAASFEAMLALVAVGSAWLVGVRPAGLTADAKSVAIGVAATVPLIAFYLAAVRVPFRPLRKIRQLLLTTIGRPLSECRWHELALLAALAGVCEELLFRGVLQPFLGRFGAPAGWVGANLAFGLAHSVTPTYFVLATGIGFYLSGVQALSGGSLVAAMIAHGLYDWFAFVQVSREYRRVSAETGAASGEGGPGDETG